MKKQNIIYWFILTLMLCRIDDVNATKTVDKNANRFDDKVLFKSGFERKSQQHWELYEKMGKDFVPSGRDGNCLRVRVNDTKPYERFRIASQIAVSPLKDKIGVSVYVKGNGKFRMGFFFYDKASRFLGSFFPRYSEIKTNQWIEKTAVYKLDTTLETNKLLKNQKTRVAKILIAFYVTKGSELYFDDFVTFCRRPAVRLSLDVDIKKRNIIDVELFVNGKAVAQYTKRRTIVLDEGLNIIGIKAKYNGASPGLRLSIPDQPELEGRWRLATTMENEWLDKAFNDQSWQIAKTDSLGYLILPAQRKGEFVYFRQIVLWGENHYSGLPCIQPKVKEWGFSEQSIVSS